MKKITLMLFILIGALIIFFAIRKQWFEPPETKRLTARTVIPAVPGTEPVQTMSAKGLPDETHPTSLIPLLPGETLINAYSTDFNKDSYDDQIIAVKGASSPFIKIIVGLYNPRFAAYERSYELITEIEQARTFSFTVMDITGTHENTLILNGYNSNNKSLFQAWLPKIRFNQFSMVLIANLQAEGTIFVQQKSRSDSYALDTANGESFPIWAYTSDPDSEANSLDQLQIMYDWDGNEQTYVQKTLNKITGKNISSKELAKIQDGTVKTFAAFLNGLWSKPAESLEKIRYLFFDYGKKEIIFLQNDTQEIYTWENSTLRRNGIFIYITNKSMPNISRRFDIALISIDEIRTKVTDDLGMRIDSDTLWDGNYKKQNPDTVLHSTLKKNKTKQVDIAKTLQTTSRTLWKGDNGYNFTFTGSVYIAQNGNQKESGVFNVIEIQGEKLLQSKASQPSGVFNGFYRTEVIIQGENDLRVILSPVKVSATRIEPAVSKNLSLSLINLQD